MLFPVWNIFTRTRNTRVLARSVLFFASDASDDLSNTYDCMSATSVRRKGRNVSEDLRTLVRETRRRRNLTQKELADRAGVGRTSLALFEVGQRDISLERFGRIARVLDLEIAGDAR